MRDDETRRPAGANDASTPEHDPERATAETRSGHGELVHAEQIGHYRLLEKVGVGGMGEVYRAEQTEPMRRTVALKIIKPGMDSREVIARFEAERQALALMDHPNIAKVFDAGAMPDGRPYFVMEFVRGIPITTYADKHKLSMQRRIELFIQLCDGVQHAHQKAIIHRDLKPSNVLVATHENQPVPKIIDFGVAKATAQKLTEKTMHTALGALIGTPEYMSPEQAEMTSEDIDTRTDVYSLGVLLYELLVGALPFDPTAMRQAGYAGIIRTLREQDPPRPSTKVTTIGDTIGAIAEARRTSAEKLRSQLRGDLDWITMRALEKDRTRRYGSAAELAADLRRHLKHEPVLAGPPSATYRTAKFVRRHRVGVGFAAVLVVLVVGFGVTMAVQANRIAHERDRANLEATRANQEAERANDEAKAAQDVTDFLVGLFDASDPRVALGDTISARQIMDLGAARIEAGEVARAPLQKARLLETMARAYQNLSALDRAGELLEQAVEVRRREQGDKHPDLARALGRLGWLRGAYQRNLEIGRKYLLEAAAIQEEAHGPDHIETAWSFYYLGSALSFGQDPCGIDYLERARAIFEDTLGAESIPVAWCWNDLSNSFVQMGDYERALECDQQATEIKARHLPPDHPDIAISKAWVGMLLIHLARCDEAKPLVEESHRALTKTVGQDNLEMGSAEEAMAALRRCLGDYEGARRSAMRAEAIYAAGYGKENEKYTWPLVELGRIALETGQGSEADSLFELAYRIIERKHGRDNPTIAWLLEQRAASLRKIGRESEAIPLEERMRAIRADWWGRREKCREQ